jgi:hypothetical protein
MSFSIFDTDGGYDALTETEPECPQSLNSRQLAENTDRGEQSSSDERHDAIER